MRDHKKLVQYFYSKADVVKPFHSSDWFYITRDKNLALGAYCIIGKGKTEESAWKSAFNKIRKAGQSVWT